MAVKADQHNQEIVAKLGKAEIITNAKSLRVEGDKLVNSLVYQDTKLNKEKKLDVSGIFVEVGYVPAIEFVGDLADVSEKGGLIVDIETLATKTPGLFSAGDCNKGKYKQIVTAAGDGAKAALAAYDYLIKSK